MIVGVDPSRSYTGIAWLDDAGELVRVERVRIGARDERAVTALAGAALEGVTRVAIEHPPPTTRARNRRGSQAVVGWGIGWVSGLLVAEAIRRCIPVDQVEVRDWRATMRADAAERGIDLRRPPRACNGVPMRRGGHTWVRWSCGHEQDHQHLYQLAERLDRGCPIHDQALDAGEDWKRRAWLWATRRWPVAVAELEAEAQRTARQLRRGHALAGVADACEAIGVAHHAWRHQ